MFKAERLKLGIEKAFNEVEFPEHRGIKAAEAMDDWVSDEDRLREITRRQDFHGPWQKVPIEHIRGNSLGFNYLDAKGVVYYLPAFLCWHWRSLVMPI